MLKFLKNIFNTIKGWFTPKQKNEKLYKFVYKDNGYYSGQHTLLIVARDPVHATKELYRVAENKVQDILEFVEIKCGPTGVETVKEVEDG